MPRGDSTKALKRIWMEGYNHARRELGLPPLVEISREDLLAVQHANCGNPQCPVCGSRAEEPKP